jgi:hypothetical protein
MGTLVSSLLVHSDAYNAVLWRPCLLLLTDTCRVFGVAGQVRLSVQQVARRSCSYTDYSTDQQAARLHDTTGEPVRAFPFSSSTTPLL